MPENRRKHARYQVAVAAEVMIGDETWMGETRDISLGGVSVSIDQEVKEKSTVELALILTQDGIEDPNEEPFETRADVMWNSLSDSGAWTLGLRFTKLAKPQSDHLQRFIAALAENAES